MIPCGSPSPSVPPPHPRRRGAASLRVVAFLGWLAVAIGGSIWLWEFNLEPGQAALAGPEWPAASALTAPEGQPVLVLFLHPRCPCSRATLEELSVLLAQAERPLKVQAVFVGEGDGAPVEQSGLWKQAKALPGVTLHKDPAGSEAERFHAETSGDAFLFDPSGRLQFRGGLTAARGHAGENYGVDSVVRIVNQGQKVAATCGPVFGCALTNPLPPVTP